MAALTRLTLSRSALEDRPRMTACGRPQAADYAREASALLGPGRDPGWLRIGDRWLMG